MKKSLIALAALASFAGVASAQSSVTLFGVVDATLMHGSGSIANKTQLVNSGYNSSRLGFRGTEDLGGGMSASFWLEAGMNNDNGTGAATNTNNQASGGAAAGQAGSQGLTFNRRSTVSLAGGWGELRLGRDYTGTFFNVGSFDPFGYNGVGTNVIALRGILSTNSTVSVRASNAIGYFTPGNLGGFYGQAQYYLGENLSNAVNKDDGRGANLRLGFATGPFNVAIGYNKINLTSAGGLNNDIKTWNLGGQYDFGVAKLMGNYQHDDQNNFGTGKGWELGGLIPIGAGEIRIAYSTYKVDVGASPKAKLWALGYDYNLSKRTALYATYGHLNNSGGSAIALQGASTGANTTSNGFDIGVRHAF